MNKFLIATHGSAAEGLKETIKILTGKDESVWAISAYVNESHLEKEIEKFFDRLEESDTAIIFTDIGGGSVNQAFLPYLSKERVFVITGINIPLILEVILEANICTAESLQNKITISRQEMKLVTEVPISNYNEEDFF